MFVLGQKRTSVLVLRVNFGALCHHRPRQSAAAPHRGPNFEAFLGSALKAEASHGSRKAWHHSGCTCCRRGNDQRSNSDTDRVVRAYALGSQWIHCVFGRKRLIPRVLLSKTPTRNVGCRSPSWVASIPRT